MLNYFHHFYLIKLHVHKLFQFRLTYLYYNINLIIIPMKAIIFSVLLLLVASKLQFFDQQKIIHHVNSLGLSWKAGHNKYFDGMTLDQIKRLMGSKQTPEQLRQNLPEIEITPLQALPTNFSSAEQWPNCESIRQVRDQSNCGSCWAFGAVQAMSDRICIASGQTLQTRISAQNLLSCCGFVCGMGCNGGYPSAAWSHFKNTGLVTGWLYNTTGWCQPYTLPPCDHHTTGKYQPCSGDSKTPKCVKSCVDGYPTSYAQDEHKASSAYSVPSNVEKIQTQIYTNGPVEASFEVYDDFLTYRTGVYHHTTGAALGGHAIKIVGWGTENGVDYWRVANSWNEDWGDNGFFKIKRGTNECGIEAGVVAGIPIVKQQLVQQ